MSSSSYLSSLRNAQQRLNISHRHKIWEEGDPIHQWASSPCICEKSPAQNVGKSLLPADDEGVAAQYTRLYTGSPQNLWTPGARNPEPEAHLFAWIAAISVETPLAPARVASSRLIDCKLDDRDRFPNDTVTEWLVRRASSCAQTMKRPLCSSNYALESATPV